MRCIFCKDDSTNSKSLEHIIPESLGNATLILKPGVVCDKCNNYFAREVDKPFLEHNSIRNLRFEEGILSKKGRIPMLQGIISDNNGMMPITVSRASMPYPINSGNPLVFSIQEGIMPSKKGKIYLPKFDSSFLPSGTILSRFLGKVALEYLASRFSEHSDWIDFLVDDTQFDELREDVRLGKTKNWPCSIRKTYDQNSTIFNKQSGEDEQIVYEIDILVTQNNEYYLVLAIFGIEFVINIGGSEVDGYYAWLNENNNQSPLYIDKNQLRQSTGL